MALGGSSRRRAFRAAAAVAGILTLLHLVAAHELASGNAIPAMFRLELAVLDLDYRARVLLAPRNEVDSRIVLVGLDERSVSGLKKYTSDADFYSALVSKIGQAHPNVVVFDVLFSTRFIGSELREKLAAFERQLGHGRELSAADHAAIASLKSDIDTEGRLASALAGVRSVVPFACDPQLLAAGDDDDSALLARAWAIPADDASLVRPLLVNRMIAPIPSLVAAATATAQTCEKADADGVLRADLAVIATVRGARVLRLPSLAIVVAGLTLGLEPGTLKIRDDGLHLGDRVVPLDAQGRLLIDYDGAPGAFRARARKGRPAVYSAVDVLDDQVGPQHLEGRVVLVGNLLAAQRDSKNTPFTRGDGERRMAGLERIAVELDSILSDRPLPVRPPWAARYGFLATAFLGLLGAVAASRLRPGAVTLAAIFSAAGVLALGAAAFTWGSIWIDSAFPALGALAPALAGVILTFSVEQDEKRFLQTAFSMYLAPELVTSILRTGELELRGEERELTILFADLRNYTRSSSSIPAAQIVTILNEHLTAMSDVILRHGGTLDKFIGDAVMAFWNAPVADADHARNACSAALEMLRALDEMNASRHARGQPTQEMGVGLATGRVIVGNIGARDRRFNYTAIGDAVNVASRLEGLTKTSDYRILVNGETRAKVGDALGFVELGVVPVKGKDEGVAVFAVASAKRNAQRVAAGTG